MMVRYNVAAFCAVNASTDNRGLAPIPVGNGHWQRPKNRAIPRSIALTTLAPGLTMTSFNVTINVADNKSLNCDSLHRGGCAPS
jgi:hypothetical protein